MSLDKKFWEIALGCRITNVEAATLNRIRDDKDLTSNHYIRCGLRNRLPLSMQYKVTFMIEQSTELVAIRHHIARLDPDVAVHVYISDEAVWFCKCCNEPHHKRVESTNVTLPNGRIEKWCANSVQELKQLVKALDPPTDPLPSVPITLKQE